MLLISLVKLIRIIAALTLLAAWLPATSHCMLGAVGAMADTCCEDAHGHENEPDPAPIQDDCGTCSNVESGDYQPGARDNFTFVFHATLAWDFDVPEPPSLTLNSTQHISSRAPPDLAVRWQFLTRTAIPGRAPAIL